MDKYCEVCLLAIGFVRKMVANRETELIQNLYLGYKNWLLLGELHCRLLYGIVN